MRCVRTSPRNFAAAAVVCCGGYAGGTGVYEAGTAALRIIAARSSNGHACRTCDGTAARQAHQRSWAQFGLIFSVVLRICSPKPAVSRGKICMRLARAP